METRIENNLKEINSTLENSGITGEDIILLFEKLMPMLASETMKNMGHTWAKDIDCLFNYIVKLKGEEAEKTLRVMCFYFAQEIHRQMKGYVEECIKAGKVER